MAEIKKYRSAKIDVVANGFVVSIGCQTVVAETPEKLIELISDYLKDPVAAENKLMENSMVIGNYLTLPPPAPLREETRFGSLNSLGASVGEENVS
jgi:hypothetical protein